MPNQPAKKIKKSPHGELSMKQKAFVEAYNGNGRETAIMVGYSEKTADSIASRLLSMVKVKLAIDERVARENKDMVASRVERQELWTKMMNDPEVRPADRLKASELLGRSEADFTDRKEIEVDQRFKEVESQADQILKSLMVNE